MRPERHYSDKNNGCGALAWGGVAILVAFLVAAFCGYDVFDEWKNP